jgi:hypothetical protein
VKIEGGDSGLLSPPRSVRTRRRTAGTKRAASTPKRGRITIRPTLAPWFFLSAVSTPKGKPRLQNHGDVLTAISDWMVALLKEFYGRGPTRTKSYYEDDLVVCVLRVGFSRVEQTLLDRGRGLVNERELLGREPTPAAD